ncbi:hypothetical protein LTR17_002944 [Elasticomyces elasticus]|nr:hypothetical protein LTR17_002944 [Elasticomyces elasticus]
MAAKEAAFKEKTEEVDELSEAHMAFHEMDSAVDADAITKEFFDLLHQVPGYIVLITTNGTYQVCPTSLHGGAGGSNLSQAHIQDFSGRVLETHFACQECNMTENLFAIPLEYADKYPVSVDLGRRSHLGPPVIKDELLHIDFGARD